MTILIAEDNVILAKSIARRLRQVGFVVETVPSVADFYHSYVQNRYELICLDLQLPDGNGLDILDYSIRANRDNVPVIVMTGTGTDEDRARAERNAAAAFLIKPFALATLLQIVEQHVKTPSCAGAG